MFIAHTGYLELFDLVVKHILPGMGLFFYFVLHFNCKFAGCKKVNRLIDQFGYSWLTLFAIIIMIRIVKKLSFSENLSIPILKIKGWNC